MERGPRDRNRRERVVGAAYSLGHCALILAGGTSVGLVERVLASRGLGRARMAVQRAAGGLVIAVGLYLLFA